MPRSAALLALVAALILSACSGPRDTAEPDEAPPTRTYRLSEFETFDPSPYAEALPPEVDVEHQVPEALMDGAIERPTARTASGFRIQVYSSQDRREADAKVEEVMDWWRAQTADDRLGEVYPGHPIEPPVYLVFRQPYYRVRVGNFLSRAEAQTFMDLIERQFPNAFILPDKVRVGE
jgi:hypothetical protein